SIDAFDSNLVSLPNIEPLGDPNYRSERSKIPGQFSSSYEIESKAWNILTSVTDVFDNYGCYYLYQSEIEKFPTRLRYIYGDLDIGGNSILYLSDENELPRSRAARYQNS
ncbi:hypothetical protein LCGC14_1974590, partial [marine sediment metagenome]